MTVDFPTILDLKKKKKKKQKNWAKQKKTRKSVWKKYIQIHLRKVKRKLLEKEQVLSPFG